MAATVASTEADKYEILEKIGHGSFGIIRKVKRKSDGKIMCRKEINYVKMTAREREQLAAEFNILNSLKHENIVGYYQRDHLRDQQEVHLYMEYCGGGDLSNKIKDFRRSQQLPSEEYVWDIIGQLSSALYRCHNGEVAPAVQGNILGPPVSPKKLRSKTQVMILHRDLKPENIFLGDDDSVKLGDFGLSKAISQHDLASTYVGTPYYMSPEICASERYGWHSDVWALGCIIYELCSGRPPFDAKTHFHLMQKIKDCRYEPLADIYSKELKALVSSCLQLNPLKRPTTRDIINMPVVRIARKGREILAIQKAVENKDAQAAARDAKLRAQITEMEMDRQALVDKIRQETIENMKTELEVSIRREWEVKARLEITKHCQMETTRMEQIFNTEIEKRVTAEVTVQMNAYKRSQQPNDVGSGMDTPPSSDLSKLSFDSPTVQHQPIPSLKKPTRTPFARAQTQVVAADSPMDVQMTSPSPMCASLALSPRRAAAMAGVSIPSLAPTNLFANQTSARERWQPQTAYHTDSENDEANDEIPDLPSPTMNRGQRGMMPPTSGGDPFKNVKSTANVRPGFRRQSTVPVNTVAAQPAIFGNGTINPTASQLPTPTSPTRRPNRLLTKAVTTSAASGTAPAGRTLIELNQARFANTSNIPVSHVTSGVNSHASSIENIRPTSSKHKEEVAVWDPEVETEMPSPFISRKGRGIVM